MVAPITKESDMKNNSKVTNQQNLERDKALLVLGYGILAIPFLDAITLPSIPAKECKVWAQKPPKGIMRCVSYYEEEK